MLNFLYLNIYLGIFIDCVSRYAAAKKEKIQKTVS